MQLIWKDVLARTKKGGRQNVEGGRISRGVSKHAIVLRTSLVIYPDPDFLQIIRIGRVMQQQRAAAQRRYFCQRSPQFPPPASQKINPSNLIFCACSRRAAETLAAAAYIAPRRVFAHLRCAKTLEVIQVKRSNSTWITSWFNHTGHTNAMSLFMVETLLLLLSADEKF